MISFDFLTEHQGHILAAILTIGIIFFAISAFGIFMSARHKRLNGGKPAGRLDKSSEYDLDTTKREKSGGKNEQVITR